MNNTLKNRIEAEARRFADRIYPPLYPQHSIARAAFAEGAKFILGHLSHLPWNEALTTLAGYVSNTGKEARP